MQQAAWWVFCIFIYWILVGKRLEAGHSDTENKAREIIDVPHNLTLD
jgi:hypothetical protein